MRLNFFRGVLATVASFLGALGLLTMPTAALAGALIVGAQADRANCYALGCTDYYPAYQLEHASSNFPGRMSINGPVLYPTITGAEVFDDAGLATRFQTGVAAQNPSPGEGLLCIALMLGMGLAARFRGLFV